MKVIEEGSGGEAEVVAWSWCIGGIGGVGRGSFGGHGLAGSKKKRLECEELVIDMTQIHEPAMRPECCIYRVPNKLRQVNKEAYTPKLVSIGPFHHDLEELKGMEKQKLKYFKAFYKRTGKNQKDLASIIEKKEEKIRHYYSETFEQLNRKKFVEIILLDAIFIIELFLRNFERKENDYILSNAWLESYIKQDLILLENQLPFKFLRKLYRFAFNGEEVTPFLELPRMFFSPTNPKLDSKLAKPLRYTATKLYAMGLEFEALVEPDFSKISLLDIDFAKDKCLERYPCFNLSWLFSCLPCLKSLRCSKSAQCILKVPQLVINDQTEALFRNIMALKQCHYPSNKYICNYVVLLDYLITTKEDVCLLVEKNVIINRRGSSKAVTTLINTLCHQIVEGESHYHDLHQQLNEHCDNLWNRLLATLTSVYFRDFWRGTATFVGFFVLAITFENFLKPFVMKI
ncbi:UPF0481 protein At3g47200-like [Alnus glutinosa]|uniref:UPF0481 protein At3g47200-like n=1 Tax=Alnus glutinosa TaxID=3517 RepID=UPI002D781709|nr:UPF0481 protein At3g47200-like [Alnus glutinosa]